MNEMNLFIEKKDLKRKKRITIKILKHKTMVKKNTLYVKCHDKGGNNISFFSYHFSEMYVYSNSPRSLPKEPTTAFFAYGKRLSR